MAWTWMDHHSDRVGMARLSAWGGPEDRHRKVAPIMASGLSLLAGRPLGGWVADFGTDGASKSRGRIPWTGLLKTMPPSVIPPVSPEASSW